MRTGISWVQLTVLSLLIAGCAYQFGYSRRSLPGGYDKVAIPVFKNDTKEVGIEVYFTNALIEEFERSKVARVQKKSKAPVVMEGEIVSLNYKSSAPAEGKANGGELSELPKGAVLMTEYRVLLKADVRLRRNSDNRLIWEGTFQSEGVYSAPQIGSPVINTANALYNNQARHQVISRLAGEMMEEAHDRMTENF